MSSMESGRTPEKGKTPSQRNEEIKKRLQEEARKRKLGDFPTIDKKVKSSRRR